MNEVIIKNKCVLEEIISRIENNQHEICLYDLHTGEVINIDDGLKRLIKLYYQDKLDTVCIISKELDHGKTC